MIWKFVKLAKSQDKYELTTQIKRSISNATGISIHKVFECILAYKNEW